MTAGPGWRDGIWDGIWDVTAGPGCRDGIWDGIWDRAICWQSWAGSTAAPALTLMSKELGGTKGNDDFSLNKTLLGVVLVGLGFLLGLVWLGLVFVGLGLVGLVFVGFGLV